MSVKVSVGSHWEIITHRKGLGKSTFTVIEIQGDYAIVHGETKRRISLKMFDRPKQYKLLRDSK